MDAAVLSSVHRQSGAAATVRVGLQPGPFPAATGSPQTREPLVSNHVAGEIDQDRSEDRPSCLVRDDSAGGGGDSLSILSGDPAADRTVETTTSLAGPRMTR